MPLAANAMGCRVLPPDLLPTHPDYSPAVADPGFSGGVRQLQNWDYFSIFCRQLHENERIWTPPGEGARP